MFFRSFSLCFLFFFFNDTATTEIYTLSLHDALPIWRSAPWLAACRWGSGIRRQSCGAAALRAVFDLVPITCPFFAPCERKTARSEEHTSELQSQSNLVCRLLLEKKKKRKRKNRCAPRSTPIRAETLSSRRHHTR